MDKSFLDIAGFAPLLNRFLRQKNSLRFGERRKKGGRTRKPPFGFTVFKGSGRQYCMQSIPLAVLKRILACHLLIQGLNCMQSIPLAVLKLITILNKRVNVVHNCMQSIPLAVLKRNLRSFCFLSHNLRLHAIHTACGIETTISAS